MILIGDDFVPSPSSLIYGYIYICPFFTLFSHQVLIKLESMEKNKSKKKADLNKMFDIWGGEGEGDQYDDDVDGDDYDDDDDDDNMMMTI